jgi:hypothetical protein
VNSINQIPIPSPARLLRAAIILALVGAVLLSLIP